LFDISFVGNNNSSNNNMDYGKSLESRVSFIKQQTASGSKQQNSLHYVRPWQRSTSAIHSSDCIHQQIAIAFAVLDENEQQL